MKKIFQIILVLAFLVGIGFLSKNSKNALAFCANCEEVCTVDTCAGKSPGDDCTMCGPNGTCTITFCTPSGGCHTTPGGAAETVGTCVGSTGSLSCAACGGGGGGAGGCGVALGECVYRDGEDVCRYDGSWDHDAGRSPGNNSKQGASTSFGWLVSSFNCGTGGENCPDNNDKHTWIERSLAADFSNPTIPPGCDFRGGGPGGYGCSATNPIFGTYSWQTHAKNENISCEDTGGIWKYSRCNPTPVNPSGLTLNPAAGAIGLNGSISLDWDLTSWGSTANCAATSTAFVKILQYMGAGGTTPTCTKAGIEASPYKTTIFQTTNNSAGSDEAGLAAGNYCWLVRALNNYANPQVSTPNEIYQTSWFNICAPTATTATTLIAPLNLSGVTTTTPTFQWNELTSAAFGSSCSGVNNNNYRLYTLPVAAGTLSCPNPAVTAYNLVSGNIPQTVGGTTVSYTPATALTQNQAYCWAVGSSNDNFATVTYSAAWQLRTPITASGKIWNATGLACSTALASRTAYSSSSATDYVIDSIKQSLVDGVIDSSGNYSISNIPFGNNINTTAPDTFTAVNLTGAPVGYTYRLKCSDCVNSAGLACSAGAQLNSGQMSDLRALLPTDSLYLGYEQWPLEGWFQSVTGDVYFKTPTIRRIPASTSPYSSDSSYMIDHRNLSRTTNTSDGLAISPSSIDVTDGSSTRISNATGASGFINYNIQNSDPVSWPSWLDFPKSPSGTTTLTPDCTTAAGANTFWQSTLQANTVYFLTATTTNLCIANATAAAGAYGPTITYTIGGGYGPAIIYITTNSNQSALNITRNIKAASTSNNRLILVLGAKGVTNDADATISTALGHDTAMTILMESNISNYASIGFQLSIITSNGSILFPKCTPIVSCVDRTIVIEGALISGGSHTTAATPRVQFDRNKYASNNYPAEVVLFDPKLLLDLPEMEMSTTPKNTGLTTYDVIWEYN